MPVAEDTYKRDVDFTQLALQYPEFSKRLKSNRQLDFSDPQSVLQLTKALLHRDFQLNIDLPEDRLCPPVPNRFNYIVFIQKLLDSTRLDYRDGSSSDERLIGLDIGTGASAIYPLLACRQRSTWAFLATEIDTKSRAYAERNVNANQLQSRIKIIDTDRLGQTLIPSAEIQNFDIYNIRIQITNPPFYSSEAEMVESAEKKSRPPNSACTGAPVEMIVEGGEVAFVSRLIAESALQRNRSKIQWFSSMLGKLSSVGTLVDQLRLAGCHNYAATEFVQGQKTRRWCIAWSWLGIRPPTAVVRGIPSLDKKSYPFPSDFDFDVPDQGRPLVATAVNACISKLDLQWHFSEATSVGTGRSMSGDVWSRKARHKRKQDTQMKIDDNEESSDDETEPALAFRVTLTPCEPVKDQISTHVCVQWLQGQDAVLFESFCGWLKRKLQMQNS